MSEQQLVNECKSYLNAHGFYVWRNNSGITRATYTNARGIRTDRMWRSGVRGASDIIGVSPDGRFIAIECKVKYRKPTPHQLLFLDEVKNRGGIAGVVYNLEDVYKLLDGKSP